MWVRLGVVSPEEPPVPSMAVLLTPGWSPACAGAGPYLAYSPKGFLRFPHPSRPQGILGE